VDLFPDARFVHIIRDPYVLFPSTMHLWRRLYRDHGFQSPRCEGLEEYVFETFSRMYEALDAQRGLIHPGRYSEVRYEDLVADPVGQMRRVYEDLELGGFDEVLPALREHTAAMAGYKTNRYEISPELRQEIGRRWGKFIEKYHYRPAETEA